MYGYIISKLFNFYSFLLWDCALLYKHNTYCGREPSKTIKKLLNAAKEHKTFEMLTWRILQMELGFSLLGDSEHKTYSRHLCFLIHLVIFIHQSRVIPQHHVLVIGPVPLDLGVVTEQVIHPDPETGHAA